ncbi:MAG: Crp/Fnr family transcriptional regulator [Burkholderiaceae bacterium]
MIASLDPEAAAAWPNALERVDLPAGAVLHESGASPAHVFFPATAIVSLQYLTENGACAEIATVGNEGVVGVSLFMGGRSTPSRSVVQGGGVAYRLSAEAARAEFDRSGPFMHLLLRYTQALITQMAQSTVCNRHHALDQQLCRWLLMRLDRSHGSEIETTQKQISDMLGVRRESVTEAALKLQRAGIIRYARGHVTVVDRRGLELRSCECYAVVRDEYDRLLPRRAAT